MLLPTSHFRGVPPLWQTKSSQNAPPIKASPPPHSNTIHSSFKRHPHKAPISPSNALKPKKQRIPFWQKKAVGANLQSSDVNHAQTHAPVYTLKSKPKLNQCKRFVLSRPIGSRHLLADTHATSPLFTSQSTILFVLYPINAQNIKLRYKKNQRPTKVADFYIKYFAYYQALIASIAAVSPAILASASANF